MRRRWRPTGNVGPDNLLTGLAPRVRLRAVPSVFISYRREDTSGEAGHLAEDLAERFGRASIFMDVNSISPGVNFEERIEHALAACQVTLVLIGDRWLTSALPNGNRRIHEEDDYVREEIAAALGRADVTVVPVLVEGAKMPPAEELPADIASLAKINVFELSNKRWRYDLDQLCDIARRNETAWKRFLWTVPRWAKLGALALAGVAAAAIAIAVVGGSVPIPANRGILIPATVGSKVNECTSQLMFAVDGTAGPLKCANGGLNALAWQYYAKFNLQIMAAGPNATPGQVQVAMCTDLHGNNTTVPKEQQAYQLAARYYGWQFAFTPDPASLRC